ncbi:MAG TPA: chromate resistance protein ChrB domain-containing protein [Bryobacteraceae bacterium]
MPQHWLLLLHQIPPSPPYFRAKVLRRLNQLGALAIKNSAYVLPETDDTLEDIQWVRSEIEQEGGEAWLFRTETLGGISSDSLRESFQSLRESEYKQLLYSASSVEIDAGQLRKLKRRFDDVRSIDFFDAPGREELETIMEAIDRKLHAPALQSAAKPELSDRASRTWVTRRGVKVDRISTAWFIRRFVDADATLRFVDPDRYLHTAGEIRFDMFEGEFTHEGDLCTFEALLRHMKMKDAALDAIAEIVHDIDLKDEKYQRAETKGIAAMISGLVALHSSDEQRIEEGSRLLDAAYAALRRSGK